MPSPQTTRDARSSQRTRTETFALNALFNGLRRLPCQKIGLRHAHASHQKKLERSLRVKREQQHRLTAPRKKTPKRVAPKSIRVVRVPHRIPHPDRPHNPPLRTSTSLFPIWTLGDVFILDTWGRVYFVHFLDILNTSPTVQNHKIYRYFSTLLFFFLFSVIAFVAFLKTLLFTDIFFPALLFHLPNIRPFIDISLFNLDTWGRVYFVHFLDILNTSPTVQNCNANLNIYSVSCRHYCRS